MRIPILAFAGILCLAGSQSTNGTPLPTSGTLLASASQPILAASHSCPKGQQWIPAGYAKHGKYRAGHCAPR
jgi:hypothetical protein